MNKKISIVLVIFACILPCCRNRDGKILNNEPDMDKDTDKLYGYNRDFLKKYIPVIELRDGDAALLIVPGWQGRIMTSTSEGDYGYSFGWINHELIASGKVLKHINPYGGEERLWLGPEGGQYSLFFSSGKDFTFENWQTPEFIDTRPFEITDRSDLSVSLQTDVSFENYSGFLFDILISRKITLLSGRELSKETGISTTGLKYVGYKSENAITSKGEISWNKETGLLSIWMLGMFNPSPAVTVVIPVKGDSENITGPKVNDNYFGQIPGDRLKVKGNHVFFRADGKSRGKIGIPAQRTKGVMGSYDAENNVLTLLFCSVPEGLTDYVNSAWEIQDDPYAGDAFNSYNDGPLEDGSQMGPFYELETSSPAAALAPGESLTHGQLTVHLTGRRKLLDRVAEKILGISLDEIENIFR